jgi:hypothetical protein
MSKGIETTKEILKDKLCYLTCSGRLDGAGAQAWANICTEFCAEYLGFTFVYTPFKHIDHNDNGLTENKWIKRWDEIMSLGINKLSIDNWRDQCQYHSEINTRGYRSKKLGSGRKVILDWGKVLRSRQERLASTFRQYDCYLVKECSQVFEKYQDTEEMKEIIQRVCSRLKKNYHSNPINRDAEYFKCCTLMDDDPNCINIAVHIRRGDVVKWNIQKRFKENDYFWNILDQITQDNIAQPYRVHVFSEGSLVEDFPELMWKENSIKNFGGRVAQFRSDDASDTQRANNSSEWRSNICMHLNGDPCVSFQHLVAADVLVTSKSCFSYVAGIFSAGKVFFTPFWFPKLLDDWIDVTQLAE